MQYTQTTNFRIDVTARLECKGEWTDYGVPNSPRWIEYIDHDFADFTIEIAGVEVKLSELPDELYDAILEEAIEDSEHGTWE